MHVRSVTPPRASGGQSATTTAHLLCQEYARHFLFKHPTNTSSKILISNPHHAHHDAKMLTIITTNASLKSPQQPTPDLFTTNATATTNHFNLITTIASTTPNVSTPLPQTPQRFPHLTITATTATSPLDTQHRLREPEERTTMQAEVFRRVTRSANVCWGSFKGVRVAPVFP